jgi:hypothetical protein
MAQVRDASGKEDADNLKAKVAALNQAIMKVGPLGLADRACICMRSAATHQPPTQPPTNPQPTPHHTTPRNPAPHHTARHSLRASKQNAYARMEVLLV